MSDSWFSEKIAPDGVEEDGCHPLEAQALKDYVRHKTNASEAAVAITRPIETDPNPRSHLYRLWGLLSDALMELSSSQTAALVQLMGAIQQLPGSGPDALWRNLPGFGHQWADERRSFDWSRSLAAGLAQEERERLRAEYVEAAGIEAHLAGAGIGAIPLDWGYECICDALERNDAVGDFEVPAATEWLSFVGDRIHAAATTGVQCRTLEKARDLWSGATLDLARWSYWQKRMRDLFEQSADGVTRAAAERAIQSMSRETLG